MQQLNLEEFQEKYRQILSNHIKNDYKNYDLYSHLNDFLRKKDGLPKTKGFSTNSIEELIDSPYIATIHEIGGTIGANAFDNNNKNDYLINDINPTIFLLDDLIEATCPHILFSEYRKLLSTLDIKIENSTKSEYYGNDIDYVIRYVSTINLYNALNNLSSKPFISNENSDEKIIKSSSFSL